MSKVIERAAASQLNTYLSANGLMPRHQSAYRKKHSTETAMHFFFFFRTDYMDSLDCLLLLLSISGFYFLVFFLF